MEEIINYHIFKAREFNPDEPIDSPFVVFSTKKAPKGREALRTFYYSHPTDLGPSLVRQIQNDYGEFPRDIKYSLSIPADGAVHKEHGRLQNLTYEELSLDERKAFLNSLDAELEKINILNSSTS